MNRRHLLATVAGLGLTGGGVWAATRSIPDGNDSGLPVRVQTIDAQGSERGEMRIPTAETPTVIDLFATWCAPCKEQMEALSTIYGEYGDRLTFVSVTNERVGNTLSTEDIREWWRTYDGNWTVGVDPASDLMAALRADGLPYIAIADRSGQIRWRHSGTTDTASLRRRIEHVLRDE